MAEDKVTEQATVQGAGDESQTALEALKTEKETLSAAMTELEQRHEEACRELASPEYVAFLESQGTESKKGAEDEVSEPDYDLMSNKELVKAIAERQKEAIATATTGAEKGFEEMRKSMGELMARVDMRIACSEHPELKAGLDDKEYRKHFGRIVEENPTWNFERVFKQITMELRIAQQDADKEKAEQANRDIQARTEKLSVPASTMTDKAVSDDEAGELSYRKAFGNQK